MIELHDQTAVITGAGSGIGRATALLFAQLGANVVIGDINTAGGEQTAAMVRSAAGNAVAVRCDVADDAQVHALIGTAVEHFGGIEILVNNAGAVGPDTYGRDTTVVEIDLALWDDIFAVNFRGVMLGCRHTIPHMVARGGGSIVNVSSIDGLVGRWGQVAYGVSKSAVNSLTEYVATTYGREGIRCNAVAPGLIMSPVAEAAYSPELRRISASNRLIPRAGTPDDVAQMIAYLASDAASFITGQVMVVDGGTLGHHPMYSAQVGGLLDGAVQSDG